MNQKAQRKQNDHLKYRLIAVGLIIAEIGCMIGYGLAGRYDVSENYINNMPPTYGNDLNTPTANAYSLILMFIFTVVGFGMLLNVYRYGNWLGGGTAIIVVAISILLGPLLQKFWFCVFISNFKDMSNDIYSNHLVGPAITHFWRTYGNYNVIVNFLMLRTALLTSISILVVMTAVVGRVTLFQIIKFTSLFHIFWPLNYYLCMWFLVSKVNFSTHLHDPHFFDMFGTTYVYLFAAFYGIPFTCLARKQTNLARPAPFSYQNQFNRLSLLLSQIGTGLIISLFVFTYSDGLRYIAKGDAISRFSILFSLLGSIVGTYIGSAICGGGRVGYKEALTGTITGAIALGAAAPILYNIGIVIMIGTVVGFLSGIYMSLIHPKINQNDLYDVLGLFGPFLIASIIGSLIILPATIAALWKRNQILPFRSYDPGIFIGDGNLSDDYPVSDISLVWNYAPYQLIYVGLSAGIGLGGGLIASLINCLDSDHYVLATNSRIFDHRSGLYDEHLNAKTPNYHYPPTPSQQQINSSSNLMNN